jgi:hypothetical protein
MIRSLKEYKNFSVNKAWFHSVLKVVRKELLSILETEK